MSEDEDTSNLIEKLRNSCEDGVNPELVYAAADDMECLCKRIVELERQLAEDRETISDMKSGADMLRDYLSEAQAENNSLKLELCEVIAKLIYNDDEWRKISAAHDKKMKELETEIDGLPELREASADLRATNHELRAEIARMKLVVEAAIHYVHEPYHQTTVMLRETVRLYEQSDKKTT